MTVPTFVGRSRRARLAVLTLTTALCTGLAAPALAGSPHPNVDANGVDLTTGAFSLQLPVASIGAGASALSLVVYSREYDNWSGFASRQSSSSGGDFITIDLGPQYDTFKSTDGYATSIRGTGATLSFSGNEVIYRTLDGTTLVFGDPIGGGAGICNTSTSANCTRLPISITRQGGMTVYFDWTVNTVCTRPGGPLADPMPDEELVCTYDWRLGGVSNSAGYAISYTYASDSVPSNQHPSAAWYVRTGSILSGGGATHTVGYAYPSTTAFTVTTPGGKVWRIANNGSLITGVRRPSASSDTTTVSYSGFSPTAVTKDGVTTSYSYGVSGNTATMVVTDAQSHQTTIVSDLAKSRPTSVTDALGRTTTMSYDGIDRPIEITNPEGGKAQYSYDGRGNLIETRLKAKPSVGGADIVTTAGYAANCVDPSCNNPLWTKDAKGNQTDYTYDTGTGLPLTVTAPASTVGAVRPQTRYGYTTVNGVALLTSVSTCRTTGACTGTADETVVTTGYDGLLQPMSVTRAAGDGSLTATTTATYDPFGNVVTVDGPLAGAGDTARAAYDADRQLTDTMQPDPDGAGSRRAAAMHYAYNGDGQVTSVQRGSVPSQATDWSGFVAQDATQSSYDGNARKTADVLTSGGTTYAKAAYGYDSLGRLTCTVQRMDPAQWAAQTNACVAQTTGPQGPDRVTQRSFDAAGQVVALTTGVGTAVAATEAVSYTGTGQVASVTDAENNRTGYAYDGYDRLSRTYYPVTTKGAGTSSTSDYEELAHDAAGNVTSRRLRDGQVLGYGYDALNRLTYEDNPGTNVAEVDVTHSYDLLGQLTRSSDGNGWYNSWGYDALGRATTVGSNLAISTLSYDLAGRLTRQQWFDGFHVTYAYDTAGNALEVKENGTTTLASFGYDALGRRTGVTRGNATTSSYAYDAVGRLSTVGHDLAGTGADLSVDFTYNPAGQIARRTSSNGAYGWTGYATGTQGYTADGLNRYSAAAGATPGYDARGNTTSVGGQSYGYNSRNQLYTTGTGGLWYRGPTGLLAQTAQFYNLDWVGTRLATESSYGVDRRYVYAPGEDTPLVWYEGGGTTDKRWLHTDERGSVVAVSGGTGAALAINRYDEYGQPAAGNLGRFGYTGQQWIAGLGLWDYKARMYAPGLGRFMQTDPIGYGDGLNLYGYVGGDPVNRVDPSGLKWLDTDARVVKVEPDIVVFGIRPVDPHLVHDPISQLSLDRLTASLLGSTAAGAERLSSGQAPQNGDAAEPVEEARLGAVIKFGKWLATKLGPKVATPVAKLPTNPSQLGHIFRNAPGHYRVDSPAARAEINRALGSFSHTDRFGNSIYSSLNPGGTQTWVQVRNGIVQNAGMNPSPVNILSRFP